MPKIASPIHYSKPDAADPFRGQLLEVFQFLQRHVATAMMVSVATRIPIQNICRFKRMLQRGGRLYEVREDTCEVTGRRARYVTCNPDLFPDRGQLPLIPETKPRGE